MNVYVSPGPLAARLSHQTRQSVLDGKANVKIEFDFTKPTTKARNPKTKKVSEEKPTGSKSTVPRKRPSATIKGKGKAKAVEVESDDEDEEYFDHAKKVGQGSSNSKAKAVDSDDMYDSDSDTGRIRRSRRSGDDEDEGESFDWSFSMREEPRPAKKQKVDVHDVTQSKQREPPKENARARMNIVRERDIEVLELSSD